MTINKRVGIGLLLLVLVVGGAFLFEQLTKAQGSQNGKLVPVVQYDKIAVYLDAGVIRQLGEQERELKQSTGNSNEVSLGFVLGSAGISDYKSIEVSGVGDSGEFTLSSREIGSIVLSPNSNSTFAMINKADGNRVMLKEVAKFYVAN
ncbi:hypothetical protein Psch_02964 [Pelotomaculum schinkii]|uniref:Uncharacterized protein n=1 Tax=Pelotomaculum schinkii TaxID=78350 RepID=A0A4Y7RAT6_9FIRM|nr:MULTISPECIES: hypothetical protein [Pelotomaculum]TEB05922.1 hypothetical protein Psch_02964 [Pelotomaculum schinkii]TEB14834.1 hypothetical protein Psfp_02606 [Pelotomaculum sp. FP]